MKRVLLTGAGGAIGVHVLWYIMQTTLWDVVVTDSFHSDHKGFFDRLSTLAGRVDMQEAEMRSRIKVIVHDLRTPFTQREIEQIGKIDYVINLASRSDVGASIDASIDMPTGASTDFVRNNVEVMLNMMEYARIAKPETFLHFSTDEVYGPAGRDSGGHPEWDAILPSNPYSASKAAQEAIGIAWWRTYGVPLIITNTMNNFGETQAPSKFPAMIQQKIERGEVIKVHAAKSGEMGTRYYLHSRNAADAVLFILQNIKPVLHSSGEMDRPMRLNIVGDKQVGNMELVEIISRLMGKEARTEVVYFHEDNPGHDLHYGLNGEKLASLGWRSPEPFEESLKSTIEWQQQHPEWMK